MGACAPTTALLTACLQVISLSGACVATFMTSVLVGGRMKAEHIQNATLAGEFDVADRMLAGALIVSLRIKWHARVHRSSRTMATGVS
eukprot:1137779-Pelagomonas_calceolata.AAC.4